MSTNIKTWQVRRLGTGAFGNDSVFMQAEIDELRAALAKYEAQMLRMATCAGEFARDACKAQAPSAPVATDERMAFEKAAAILGYMLPDADEAFTGFYHCSERTERAWKLWQARAALSVKAEQRAAVHRRVLQNSVDGPDVVGPTVCNVPPPGWYCTRAPGHDGPCAAYPAAAPTPPTTGEA